ncbi:hypothetical protein FOZ62_029140, partial [Perkinsus olseni]
MSKSSDLTIPDAVASTVDSYHLEKLYCVCRLCFNRLPTKNRQSSGKAPSELVCTRAKSFYQIDFYRELTNLTLPKVLCSSCSRRLSDFATLKQDPKEWDENKRHFVDALLMDTDSVVTRRTTICPETNRCRVCLIASSRLPTQFLRSQSSTPAPGRPIEQSPARYVCTKCGADWLEHDEKITAVKKRPRSSGQAGERFAERVDARGFSDGLLKRNLASLFEEAQSSQSQPSDPVAAMMVGIQSAASKYPCPFCLFVNASQCSGKPAVARSWNQQMADLKEGAHNAKQDRIVAVLKALKAVKDTCLGLQRQNGWKDSLRDFRLAWQAAGLRWPLKAHILSDHVEEYLETY